MIKKISDFQTDLVSIQIFVTRLISGWTLFLLVILTTLRAPSLIWAADDFQGDIRIVYTSDVNGELDPCG